MKNQKLKKLNNLLKLYKSKKACNWYASLFIDIKKNHAIVAWFSRGLPVSLEIKTPIVYNESMTCQSKIKNTIGGY